MLNKKIILAILVSFINMSFSKALTDDQIIDIKLNTFVIVPINPLAQAVSKERAQSFYDSNCGLENLSPKTMLNCLELKDCSGDSCVAPFANHGTGFLLEEGSRLVSAWHVLIPTHLAALTFLQHSLNKKTVEQRRSMILENTKPEFVLLNQDLEKVYDTRLETENNLTKYEYIGDPLAPIFSSNGQTAGSIFGFHESNLTDVVSVRLTKDIGAGLKLSTKNLRQEIDSDEFFNAGFGFDRYDFGFTINSGSKESLFVLKERASKGYDPFQIDPSPVDREYLFSLSLYDQLIVMGYSEDISKATIDKYPEDVIISSRNRILRSEARHQRDYEIESNPNIMFTDVKSLPGHSGSPFLNSEGEVIGVVTTGFINSGTDKDVRIESFGSGVHLISNEF